MNAAKQGHALETEYVQWIAKLFGNRDEAALPLYMAIVARARAPHWYEAGAVPDSIDGRFDMVATILAFMLLRLEGEAAAGATSASLAERFVEDMDGQLRERGIGDVVVGKHVGRMMGALGGRLGAYRDALVTGDLDGALTRNLYRGEAPDAAALGHVRESLLAFRDALAAAPTATLIAGKLPVTTTEFHRPERIDTIGEGEREITVTASAAERAALAVRFGLKAIDRLEGVFPRCAATPAA